MSVCSGWEKTYYCREVRKGLTHSQLTLIYYPCKHERMELIETLCLSKKSSQDKSRQKKSKSNLVLQMFLLNPAEWFVPKPPLDESLQCIEWTSHFSQQPFHVHAVQRLWWAVCLTCVQQAAKWLRGVFFFLLIAARSLGIGVVLSKGWLEYFRQD